MDSSIVFLAMVMVGLHQYALTRRVVPSLVTGPLIVFCGAGFLIALFTAARAHLPEVERSVAGRLFRWLDAWTAPAVLPVVRVQFGDVEEQRRVAELIRQCGSHLPVLADTRQVAEYHVASADGLHTYLVSATRGGFESPRYGSWQVSVLGQAQEPPVQYWVLKRGTTFMVSKA